MKKHWITTALTDSATPPEVVSAARQKLLSAFRVSRGCVALTGRILEANPQTVYRWLKADESLARELEAARGSV